MRDYLNLLARPVIRRLVFSVLPARIAYSMVSLTIFFYVHETTDSLTKAGIAIGAASLAGALTTGPRGSLIDRVGQTGPLLFFVPLYAATLIALSLTTDFGTLVGLCAFLGLASPPINISSRPLWKVALPAGELRVGYALDSISINSTMVLGPTLSTAVSLSVGGDWALRLIAMLMLLGGSLMVTMPLSRNWRREEKDAGQGSLFRSRAIRLMAFDGVFFGFGNGVFVVGIPAAATLINRAELTAPMLSASAVASILGGFVAGLVSKKMTALRGMLLAYTATGLGTIPLPWVRPGWQMGALLVVTGFALGMSMVFHWEVIEAVRPRGTAVGALAWLWSIEGTATAIGSAVGGYFIDNWGITRSLLITVVMYNVATAIVVAGRALLNAADQLPEEEDLTEALADTANPPS